MFKVDLVKNCTSENQGVLEHPSIFIVGKCAPIRCCLLANLEADITTRIVVRMSLEPSTNVYIRFRISGGSVINVTGPDERPSRVALLACKTDNWAVIYALDIIRDYDASV